MDKDGWIDIFEEQLNIGEQGMGREELNENLINHHSNTINR
jgi:hypothetical protein